MIALSSSPSEPTKQSQIMEANVKPLIALSALLITGFVTASTEQAGAVVYCQYIGYPASCVARPGVVLRPRPVARAAAREAARPRTSSDRGARAHRACA